MQARFPEQVPKESQRFPRTGFQARFPSNFPEPGSQASFAKIPRKRFAGRGSQEHVSKQISQTRFAKVLKQGSERFQVPSKRFPKIPQGCQKQVLKQGFQRFLGRGSQAMFSRAGSQARFPSKVLKQGFGKCSQEEVPKGSQEQVPKQGPQARFPRTGSQADFQGRFARIGFQARVPKTGFQEQVPKRAYQARVPKQSSQICKQGVQAQVSKSKSCCFRSLLFQTVPKYHSDKYLLTFSCSCCCWGYSLGIFGLIIGGMVTIPKWRVYGIVSTTLLASSFRKGGMKQTVGCGVSCQQALLLNRNFTRRYGVQGVWLLSCIVGQMQIVA